MKKVILLASVALLVMSCITMRSAFTSNDITIGTTKADIVSKYGAPFLSEIHEEPEGYVDVYIYKELLPWEGSFIYTYLFFKNEKLFRKTQEEVIPAAIQNNQKHKKGKH